jgi:hypothetical protein
LTWKRRNLRARGIQGCRSIPAADTIAEVATVWGHQKKGNNQSDDASERYLKYAIKGRSG